MTGLNRVIVGDAPKELRRLPSASVDCCVTSPPYFRLRNYQVEGQLGLEPSVQDWVANLRAICSEIARVLVPTGSLWLNVADSYSRQRRFGAQDKACWSGRNGYCWLCSRTAGWSVTRSSGRSPTQCRPLSRTG